LGAPFSLFIAELGLPEAFSKRSNKDILAYLRLINSDARVPVCRARVMLVGPEKAGKTTLANRLLHGRFLPAQERTDGVEMHDWQGEAADFQLWDFGGQDVYFNSHPLFFHERCIYLMIWNPTAVEESQLFVMLEEYFAQVCQLAPAAKIFLVSTCSETQGLGMVCEEELKKRYPRARYFPVDSSTGQGIAELKTSLATLAAEGLQLLPGRFLRVENVLKSLRGSMRFSIPKCEYDTIARKAGLDQEMADLLLYLLHEWGVVHRLRGDNIVLQPQDLADVLRSVITIRPCNVLSGILKHDALPSVWHQYHKDLHRPLLALLHEQEVAFPLFDAEGKELKASLVPAMLSDSTAGMNQLESRFLHQERLMCRVSMEFSPRSKTLFPKLQARLQTVVVRGALSKQHCFVQIEEEFASDPSWALLRSDSKTGRISVDYPAEAEAACAAALRCVALLVNDNFAGVQISTVVLEFGEVVLTCDDLQQLLRADRNAMVEIAGTGEDEQLRFSIGHLRVLFGSGNFDEVSSNDTERMAVGWMRGGNGSAIPADQFLEMPRELRRLHEILERVRNCSTQESQTDVADLSMCLILAIPYVVQACGLNARHVFILWVEQNGRDGEPARLVPVSPGASLMRRWRFVQEAAIAIPGSFGRSGSNENGQICRLLKECFHHLGLGTVELSLPDMGSITAVLLDNQDQHFERAVLAEGTVAWIHTFVVGSRMPDEDQVVARLEKRLKLQHEFNVNTHVLRMHQHPLLYCVTQPDATGLTGWFQRMYANVYRMHFVCTVCGRKAPSGESRSGYRIVLLKKATRDLQKCVGYTLTALELISLLTPVPLPHLADIADYVPSESVISEHALRCVIDKCKSAVRRNMQLPREKGIGDVGLGAHNEISVDSKDVNMLESLLERAGDDSHAPIFTGLKMVWFGQDQYGWVCDPDHMLPLAEHLPANYCQARFQECGDKCLKVVDAPPTRA
jgi:hypothetical protein